MRLTTETLYENKLACILTHKDSPFLVRLAELLKDKGIIVEFHKTVPENQKLFSYFFIATDSYEEVLQKLSLSHDQKVLIFFPNKESLDHAKKYITSHPSRDIKALYIPPHWDSKTTVHKTLWFLFSTSAEKVLDLSPILESSKHILPHSIPRFTFSQKNIVKIVFTACIGIELFFLIPLSIASTYLFLAANSLKKEQMVQTDRYLTYGRPFVSTMKLSYTVARPLLAFLFLAVIPDRIVTSVDELCILLDTVTQTSKQSRRLGHLVLIQQKTPTEQNEAARLTKNIAHNMSILSNTSLSITEKLDLPFPFAGELHTQLTTVSQIFADTAQLAPYINEILTNPKPYRILVFFYNNMELRPGGGFLGSFALVTFEKYTLKEFTVYDVYDADGQLTIHIEPPRPIRQYLRQPHWFLRDSNFSPDFAQNVATAEDFLHKELELEKIDSAVGITTTGLSYLLSGYKSLYIPDFNEYVTPDNFYLKAQARVEEDYFPGSKRKKHFLSSVGRTMFLQLENISYGQFTRSLKKALDEKHVVVFSKDAPLQDTFIKNGWGGNLVSPVCAGSQPSCTLIYLYPIDANVGVNKANLYVSRSIRLHSTLTDSGSLSHSIRVTFTNTSPAGIGLGGAYHNYFQLYMSRDSTVKSVLIDGHAAPGVDQYTAGSYRIIGVPITVAPRSKNVVELSFTQKEPAIKDRRTLQIVVQKQIGMLHTDFGLELKLPKKVSVLEKNFTSVAKGNTIVYNTPLSNDQIFLIELEKH